MRVIARIFLWLLATVGGLTVLFMVIGVAAATHRHPAALPKHMMVSLDIDQGVAEVADGSPLAAFGLHRGYLVKDIVEALDHAARDPRVAGLVARIDSPSLGMAQTQELRDAILAFRKSGKRTVAYATSLGGDRGGTTAYYLAASFQEIWLQPSGDVNLTGFRLETPFLKGTFDLLGIKPEFAARYEYKSAIETYTRDHFSKEGKDSWQGLIDGWTRQVVDGIASGRSMSRDQVTSAINQAPLLATEALHAKLVDRLAYWDEVEQNLKTGGAEFVDLNRYHATLEAEPTAVKVALIYGVGEIEDGDADPLSNKTVMTAGRVAQAFRDAAKDTTVKAILFRIDSPGGSYTAADTIWREVGNARAAGKPVVVSMGDVAASGGYLSAIPADRIVAEPGTITGSIGAYTGKFVVADLWKRLGLSWDDVHSGQNSGMWSANSPFSPTEWQRVNAGLDAAYTDFTAKVQHDRHLKVENIDGLARGRIWLGEQGRQNGLVDETGGYEEAFVLIRQLAKLPSQMPVNLVPFPHPKTPLQVLVEMAESGQVPEDVASSLASLRTLSRLAAPLADLAPTQQRALRLPTLDPQ